MRKTLILAGLMIGAAAAPAWADGPGKDWMPLDQVLARLAQAGYGPVRGIEADDGVWKGKTSRDGRPVSVSVDPHSGAVAEKTAGTKRDERDDD